jgi:hypothetical protein
MENTAMGRSKTTQDRQQQYLLDSVDLIRKEPVRNARPPEAALEHGYQPCYRVMKHSSLETKQTRISKLEEK